MSSKLINSAPNLEDSSITHWMVKWTRNPYDVEKHLFQALHALSTDVPSTEESSKRLFDSQSSIDEEAKKDNALNHHLSHYLMFNDTPS